MLSGVPKTQARERALELLDTVGLDRSLAKRYPSQLSGGQQQRVGVARGLAADPNILLMDEPFGAVDPIVRAELQQELIRLQRELDKTVVFVTHDIDEAFLLGDQVVILEKGARIAQVGIPERDHREPGRRLRRELHRLRPRAPRALRSRRPTHGTVVVDSDGRTQGVIVGDQPVNWVSNNLDLIWELTLVHLRQSIIAIILGFVLVTPARLARLPVSRGTRRHPDGHGSALHDPVARAASDPAGAARHADLQRAQPDHRADDLRGRDHGPLGGRRARLRRHLVRLSATAIGYGAWRRFWAVDFPLAGPVMLAGLRVTAVSTIALATVGALIGVTNLGYLFTNGSQRRIIPEVLAGIVAVLLIALVIDGLLIAAGRVLMPWTRAQRRRVRRAELPLEVRSHEPHRRGDRVDLLRRHRAASHPFRSRCSSTSSTRSPPC